MPSESTTAARDGGCGDVGKLPTGLRLLKSPARGHVRRRLLVLKLDHFGDFVMGLPAFESLRNYFPNDEITLVCGSWNKTFAKETGLFDRVVTHDFFPRNARDWNRRSPQSPKHFAGLLSGTYDVAVDLRVDPDTRILLQHVHAKLKFGLGTRREFPYLDVAILFNHPEPQHAPTAPPHPHGRWWFLSRQMAGIRRSLGIGGGTDVPLLAPPEKIEEQPAADNSIRFDRVHRREQFSLLVRLIAERAGAIGHRTRNAANPREFALVPSGKRVIYIVPFSNSELRDWPITNYAELIERILSCFDMPVVLLGAPEHQEALDSFVSRVCTDGRLINLAGKTSWTDLPDLFANAALVVCNNSGAAHYAAACGAPVAAIYSGSHLPEEWGPRGANDVLVMTTDLPCSPCGLESIKDCGYDRQCMKLWTAERVFGQIQEMLV